jgi:hypothetical protein
VSFAREDEAMRDQPETVEVTYEPCPEFAASDLEPGICAHCGWLDDEHPAAAPLAA